MATYSIILIAQVPSKPFVVKYWQIDPSIAQPYLHAYLMYTGKDKDPYETTLTFPVREDLTEKMQSEVKVAPHNQLLLHCLYFLKLFTLFIMFTLLTLFTMLRCLHCLHCLYYSN